MQIPQTSMQRFKVSIHGIQGLLAAIGACMSLAVLVMEGKSDGRVGFYFAMCLLTNPALIYLTMVPLWTRARLFQSAYIYALLDILYTILWLAAFASMGDWNRVGLAKGSKAAHKKWEREHEKDKHSDNDNDKRADDDSSSTASDAPKDIPSGCAAFAFGSATKCQVSQGSIALGVLLCLLFVGTTYLSIRGVLRYRATGELPGSKRGVHKPRHGGEERPGSAGSSSQHGYDAEATKDLNDAWSTHTGDLDDHSRAPSPYDSATSPYDPAGSDRLAFGQPSPPRAHSRLEEENGLLSPTAHRSNTTLHSAYAARSSNTLHSAYSAHSNANLNGAFKSSIPNLNTAYKSSLPSLNTAYKSQSNAALNTEYSQAPAHPGRQLSYSSGDDLPPRIATPSMDAGVTPSALSPTGVYGGDGRVSFPRGFYGADFR